MKGKGFSLSSDGPMNKAKPAVNKTEPVIPQAMHGPPTVATWAGGDDTSSVLHAILGQIREGRIDQIPQLLAGLELSEESPRLACVQNELRAKGYELRDVGDDLTLIAIDTPRRSSDLAGALGIAPPSTTLWERCEKTGHPVRKKGVCQVCGRRIEAEKGKRHYQ